MTGDRTRRLPPGWDDARVRAVIAHDESQTEDEQADEIERAVARARPQDEPKP